MTHSIPFTL